MSKIKLCAQHFVRAGTDLYCDFPEGHDGDHGLLEDYSPTDPQPSFESMTMVEHEKVLARAAAIFEQHTKEHGELWREADATELGAMARHKANRVNYAARRYQDKKDPDGARARIVDSGLDCINYCVFIIRLVEGG